MKRHGEGFETSPAPNHFDHARIIMASRQIRPIRVEGNVAYVPLTKGYEAIIDAADVPLVEGKNWHAYVALRSDGSIRSVYGSRNPSRAFGTRRPIWLHRVIVAAAPDIEVDHIDGNGLNNRRNNLRCATQAQNTMNCRKRADNSSGVKGVHFHKGIQKWVARIQVGGARHNLGAFSDAQSAAAAYAAASVKMHGKFGRLG